MSDTSVCRENIVKRKDPNYIREYYHARKAQNPEYYNLHSRRKYYRKQLKSLSDDEGERKTKIMSKLEEVDKQLQCIKESRNKYTRWQGIRSKSPSDTAAHFYEAADAAA